MIGRRQALVSTLFGAGYIGLRALATGLPASILLNPRRTLAAGPPAGCATTTKAQYILLNTSGNGDPINANVPGTYEDPKITHSQDPTMPPTSLTIQGQTHTAAAPRPAPPPNAPHPLSSAPPFPPTP